MKTSPMFAMFTMFAVLGLVVSGCEERTAPQGQTEMAGAAVRQAPSAEQTAEPSAAALMEDKRTQYDLAAVIGAAERLPRDQAALELPEIRRDWVNRRYQWKVDVIPALCASVERCNVLPFDTGNADRHITQGWMPRLELDEADFASIQRACANAERCTITFRGTLTKLVLSTDEFTALGFTDVEIL